MEINEIITWFLTVCGGITCIAAAVNWLVKAWQAIRRPDKTQNEKLKDLEAKAKEHDDLLLRDCRKIEEMQEGNRVTHRALFALLKHAIDGNDIDGMKESLKELQEFLIRR